MKTKDEYITAKNPSDNKWYVLGLVRNGSKNYYMPVSHGYNTKDEATKHCQIQPKIDYFAKVEGSNI